MRGAIFLATSASLLVLSLASQANAQGDYDLASAVVQDAAAAPAPSAGGCGGCGCGAALDNCCWGQGTGWFAGVEATYLKPDIEGLAVGVTFGALASDFVDDFYGAPRIWIGHQGRTWGLVARYWHIREAENHYEVLPPPITVFADSHFEAAAFDLEATRNVCLGGNPLQFSFGARYAELRNSVFVLASGLGSGASTANGLADYEFDGVGLTASLQGRRPLGCGWALFWNLRGSAVWGDAIVTSRTTSLADGAVAAAAALTEGDLGLSGSDTTGNAVANGEAVPDNDDQLWIGEIQVGAEWHHALQCMPADVFLRLAFEYQTWDGPGGTAASAAVATGANTFALAVARARDVDAELYGIALSTGIMY